MKAEDFAELYHVSRETISLLSEYEKLLKKWNPHINLVAPSTLDKIWSRHFADSAALAILGGSPRHWLDMGSGGGFPGLVVACLLRDQDIKFTFIESDTRKCAFLRQAARSLDLDVHIETSRIEHFAPQAADVISARALAPLTKLFEYMDLHGNADTVGLFPKGIRWQEDLHTASTCWTFRHTTHPGGPDSEGVVLRIEDLKSV